MKKVLLTILGVMLFIISNAQDHHWTPVLGFEDTMDGECELYIDGELILNENYELGVFCGDECRDSRFIEDGLYYITMGGVSGETFTFRLWDHSSNSEMNLICTNEPIDYEANGFLGWDEPYPITFTSPITGYTLDITGYDADEGGNGSNWYLISTPVGEVDPATIEGMTDGDFDLFYFNQSDNGAEWKNYEANHFNLEPCKGYLYAHSTNVTLNFGTDAYSGSGVVTLVKDDNANLAGWNLIGNPFGVAASPMRTDNETGDWVLCPFYVMNKDGDEIVVGDVTSVEPMQGIFVVAERDREIVTFTPGASADDGNKLVINVAQNRSGVIDRAIVRFGQGNQLPKFMLNDNNTKLYIPQADNDYAVVRSDNEAELPLNFKAAANGTYILKVDANSTELDYLHLIDNKTGNDIDLLENPSYTFEANATDFANRFKLVLRNTTSIDENTNFAFYNGLDWTVNNEGKSTLQVVDMTGRIVSTETIDGTAHVTINAAPGAYMLQLTNGNDVKTQKVVIK